MTFDLITVGRANLDLFSTDIGAPFAEVRHFEAMVGGSPTNVAIATTRLGLKSIAFTAVGEDRVGDLILDYLENEKVVTDWVFRIPGKSSSLALLGVEPPDGFPLTFFRDDPADIHLTPDQAATLPIGESAAVCLTGNAFSRGSCVDAAWFIATTAHEQGLTVFLDLDLRPTEWATPAAYGATLRAVLPFVDVVIGTEEEMWALLSDQPEVVMDGAKTPDLDHLDRLVEEMANRAPAGQVVVQKRGPRGASVLGLSEGTLEVKGFDVEVVNTVGAGDAFASGLITRRLRDDDWNDAVTFANACGALEVQRHGCSRAFPFHAEVEAFLTDRLGATRG